MTFTSNSILRLRLLSATLSMPALALSQSPPPSPPPQTAPVAKTEQVTVTAYRAPLGVLESPVTTRLLTMQQLRSTAGVTFDDQLRQLPGVELFRRSPSLVANPTSQGISLRALGSTSASRTLVVEEDVPLNDPLGGWIHWQEQPELSIRDVELVRGGLSDLYGSSAIGGAVNIVPVLYSSNTFELRSSEGGEGTYDNSLLAAAHPGPWNFLAAGGLIGTDGYIQESPSQRGPVDQASNVHSQNALVVAAHDFGALKFFIRGSGFDESRHNGTPYQINATRLIRYFAGADWQNPQGAALVVRLYGSDERYRQTFSSISNLPNFGIATCTFRCGETPTRLSFVPDNELGGALHFSRPFGAGFLLIVGADARDVRVWDREQTYGATAALTNLADHQRDTAAYAEIMWEHKAWTIVASSRFDWFKNYDAHETQFNGAAWVATAQQSVQNQENIFDPRLGLSRKLSAHWALTASGFRAFRAPTPNELYRTTTVGSKTTFPNGALFSERATGWEAGLATQFQWGSIRTSYFLTQVNRPIVALTQTATTLTRENLGQIESRGVSVDFTLAPRSWLSADGGYQYAHAVVSRGAQDFGNWIPDVARNLATLNLRASRPSIGTLSLQSRLSGRQFDDDANAFLLHGYFRLDVYASHTFAARSSAARPRFPRIELFAAGENLFNRSIEVSKTPTTTLGQPRTARAGLAIHFGRTSD